MTIQPLKAPILSYRFIPYAPGTLPWGPNLWRGQSLGSFGFLPNKAAIAQTVKLLAITALGRNVNASLVWTAAALDVFDAVNYSREKTRNESKDEFVGQTDNSPNISANIDAQCTVKSSSSPYPPRIYTFFRPTMTTTKRLYEIYDVRLTVGALVSLLRMLFMLFKSSKTVPATGGTPFAAEIKQGAQTNTFLESKTCTIKTLFIPPMLPLPTSNELVAKRTPESCSKSVRLPPIMESGRQPPVKLPSIRSLLSDTTTLRD
ncbi:hypothetical protein GYMLUDRAFT_242753 [Collybiopsis luxurians FD-317 M1]|uniref:Uncharacterized protein n=1 Tax=Collybiopsis luxurians FD-317 M1 TaxID=944289 RepID=A0A0D0C3C8_9AGAR|nr:hypothetical protein GYMLUDRAFT_242753 [Collybiopsis luxurians FD-317 M1]